MTMGMLLCYSLLWDDGCTLVYGFFSSYISFVSMSFLTVCRRWLLSARLRTLV